MACHITLQEYQKYFLLKNQEELKTSTLTLANVYKLDKFEENLVYSNKIVGGGKNTDPLAVLVEDLIGKKGILNHAGGPSSQLQNEEKGGKGSKINVEIITSKSPGKVGADGIKKLLEYCNRNSMKISVTIMFGHSYSWDNKYNINGIQDLHKKSVQLKPISFQQILNWIVNDIQDTLEYMDQLQTSRGLLQLDYTMIKRAVVKIRDALHVKSDFYFQDHQEKLQNILGYDNVLDTHVQPTPFDYEESRNLSLSTYLDYFLLQNNDKIWAKLKVTLSKLKIVDKKIQTVPEQVLFEQTYDSAVHDSENLRPNNGTNGKNSLNHNSQLKTLKEKLSKLVGDSITLNDINNYDEVRVQIEATVSEYPDRLHWNDVIKDLYRHLVSLTSNTDKVDVLYNIRYATLEQTTNQSANAENNVSCECMTLRDILFEMIEDLEDSLVGLGRFDYGRGANLKVDVQGLGKAMGMINRAISVRTNGDEMYSMNDEFRDVYSEN